jgi:acyl-CoA reductase-like NAD-dependent aldehyde dehydrogenase
MTDPDIQPALVASTGWLPWSSRRAWLRSFRKAVAASALEMARLVSEEIGKSEGEAYVSEVLPLLAAIRWHERRAWRVLSPRVAPGRPAWLMGRRVRVGRAPLGRVLIVATWNYPVGLLGVQLVQAVVAGNRVTVKPSERSPRSQLMLMRLAASCGLPADWLLMSEATRAEGERLVTERGFDKIIFTGGSGTGGRVAAAAALTLTPSVLELSGADTAMVLADADPTAAAARLWQALTMNAGQTCIAPRRALVDRKVYRAFLDALAPLAAGARPVRLSSAEEACRCHGLAVAAVQRGGRSLSGVLEPASDGWIRPLVVADCPVPVDLFQGAHFGPVLAVVPVDGLGEMIALHARVAHRLSVSLYTRRARRLRRDPGFVAALGASLVTFNESITPIGHPGVSLSGVGPSGWGATRGEAGLLELSRPLSVSETAAWTPAAIPPEGSLLRTLDRLVGWWHGAVRPKSLTDPGSVHGAGAAEPINMKEMQS